MRTINIPHCSYEQFAIIKKLIMKHVPFALINDSYIADEELAIFQLWDGDYVPDGLQKFVLRPPNNAELMKKFNEELEKFNLFKT